MVAAEFWSTIGRLAPELAEEMRGIADGVGAAQNGEGKVAAEGEEVEEYREKVDVLDIVALNARSEIALGQWDDGCTALAWHLRAGVGSLPTQTQTQILAQNWDWRRTVGPNLALANIRQEGKLEIWMVIEVRPVHTILRWTQLERHNSRGL